MLLVASRRTRFSLHFGGKGCASNAFESVEKQIKTENNQNILRGTLPQTFLNAQNKPHHNTICDGILVLEKYFLSQFESSEN